MRVSIFFEGFTYFPSTFAYVSQCAVSVSTSGVNRIPPSNFSSQIRALRVNIVHCQRILFMKSAVALIEQNDPQLQTQLDVRFSVSHPEKDHRTPQKRNSFIIPSFPSGPFLA